MDTEAAIERDDDPDVEEIELVVEDGLLSDEEVETLRVLVETLPSDVDLLDIAAAHDRLVQARRGREERQPREDLVRELDLIRELEGPAVPAVVATAEREFVEALVDYGYAMVRVARLHGAHERLRGRIAAVEKIRAKLLTAGRTDDARKLAKHIEAAKRRLREPPVPPGVESGLAGHEARVNVLLDRLTARSGDDPEREAAVAKVRKAERALERAEAQQAHERAEAEDTAARRRWPRRKGRA